VEQRDFDCPTMADWVETLARAVSAAPGPALVVAHSLGCALVAHWAAAGATGPVAGALLVAPADVDARDRTPPETRCFAPMPLAPLPFAATVVASRDDPFVALERARFFAERWGARFVDVGARGHINATSDLGDWPDGRRHLDELAARALK
jgi:predicted alpha/beta hydrolase family esterase